jgi:hypothetical protein
MPKPRERTPAEYRTQAERAHLQAKAATNKTVQRRLVATAGSYDDLARTAEAIVRQRDSLQQAPRRASDVTGLPKRQATPPRAAPFATVCWLPSIARRHSGRLRATATR